MKITIVLTAIAGLAAIAPIQSTLRAEQGAARSVLDGVYTEEQAKRGEMLFGQDCASCHGPALMGTEMAPPLTGASFMMNWTDATVGELFDKIRLGMPADDPGSLNGQQTADLVTHILKVGKYPAGKTDLGTDVEALRQIKIVPPKP